MYIKEPGCDMCVLKDLGKGFVYPEGSITSGVMLVGESAGQNEAMEGYPFRPYAPAGSILERAIKQIGMSRDMFGIYNIIGCQPPGNKLLGEAYEVPAINHCMPAHLQRAYNHFGRPKVVVALGAVAARALTGLTGEKLGLDLIRGFPIYTSVPWMDPDTIIVPTYHPSHIVQGQHALLLVLMRDLQRAVRIAKQVRAGEEILTSRTYKPDYRLHMTSSQVREVLNWIKLNPQHPISYDFEATGSTTGDLNDEDLVNKEMDITQVNLSLGPRHALVYDYDNDTRGLTWDILGATPNAKFGHNVESFDNEVALWNGFEVRGDRIDDTMLAYHFMYSDIPGSKGGADTKSKSSQDDDGAFAPLQFCASWYEFPLLWKHLSKDDPHLYGGYDADSCYWVRNGVFADLNAYGIFKSYDTFIVEVRRELNKMQRRGVSVDPVKLKALADRLRKELIKAKHTIQEMVPDDLKTLKAIKKPTKLMQELALRLATAPEAPESFRHLQVPTPQQVIALPHDQLPPEIQEFVKQAARLREHNKEGKISSLGYRVGSFDFYNQKCECLRKTLAPTAISHCAMCSGTGTNAGATSRLVKCPTCNAAKAACPACHGEGFTAEAKPVKAPKGAKKGKRDDQAVLPFDGDPVDAPAVACSHRFVLHDEPVVSDNAETAADAGGVDSGSGPVDAAPEKRGRARLVCKLCGVQGQKKKPCKCLKQVMADCSTCGGVGKIRTYIAQPCKCRVRQVPNPECSDCHGVGLFTGRKIRWAKIMPFNAKSSKQMMAYAKSRGYTIPMNSKRKIAMDKETVNKLAKSTGDPLFKATITLRELDKIYSSYALGWSKAAKHAKGRDQWVSPKELDRRLKAQQTPVVFHGRIGIAVDPEEKQVIEASVENLLELAERQLASNAFADSDESYLREYHRACARAGLQTVHTEFSTKPATGQLSSLRPNIQVAPNQSKYGQLATEFRECVVAPPGYTIVECVAVGTRVLMQDLTWRKAEEVQQGEKLWGFDETPVKAHHDLKRPGRYLRATTVLSSRVKPKQCLEVITDQGSITVSADHSFAGRQTHYNKSGWIQAKALRPGMKIGFFTRPWDSEPTLNRSYLSGFFDGEGHVTGVSSAFSQNDGQTASDVIARLATEGFGVRRSLLSTNPNSRCYSYAVQHDQAFAGVRFCGQVRPARLLAKMIENLEGTATWGKSSKAATVLEVRDVGIQDVVVMETDRHTLITEGFLSHNCDYRSFHVLTLGYEAQDPDYIRLARLDPHSYLAANLLGLPGCKTCLNLPDDELRAYLKHVKKNHETVRNKQAKPAILGYGFGMGAGKLFELNPDAFSSFIEAANTLDMLNHVFPRTAQYRLDSPELAHRNRVLFSKFGCPRWFMNVKTWDSGVGAWKHGKDWEKSIAFRPANIAFCVIKLAKLRLKARGLAGKFGLVNNIHDALLFICPDKYLEECLHIAREEMERPEPAVTAPDGSPFWCGVEAKMGPSWADMKEYNYGA